MNVHERSQETVIIVIIEVLVFQNKKLISKINIFQVSLYQKVLCFLSIEKIVHIHLELIG